MMIASGQTEIVIIAEIKIIGKEEDWIEVEINIVGITPEMNEEIPEVKNQGKFANLYFLNISKVIGKITTAEISIAEIEGAKTMADTEETVEADLQAEITGIKIQLVVVTVTSVKTEAPLEIKKVIPVIILGVAITIHLKTRNNL